MTQYDPRDVVILQLTLIGALAVAVAVVGALGLRRRRGNRRRADDALRREAAARARLLHRRRLETELAAGCAHAVDVEEVVELLHDTLVELDPRRPHELHLVDPHEPVLRLVFATGATPRRAPEDVSPWQARAIRAGETLVYDTTDAPDVCPHLRSRLVEHCSAVAVPLVATDRLLGVLYATGPDGVAPTSDSVATYEHLARTAAATIAALHALAEAADAAADDDDSDHGDDREVDLIDLSDDLLLDDRTRLAGRADAVAVIDALVAAPARFTLLLFDIDGFGTYHARYGGPAGDDAVATMAEAATQVLGGAGLFRLDGDHLLVVLAGATAADGLRVVDELRGEIGRALRAHDLPSLTVSFGVVEAGRGTDTARVLDAVHDALYNARARGDASTVVGSDLAPRGG